MKVNYQSHEHEHEFEATHGLPEPLPRGERLLWQGAPDGWLLAVEALHVRKAALYFALLLAWRTSTLVSEGASLGETLIGSMPLLLAAMAALGILAWIAWLIARTTVYTLTDRRVVMRIGIVLSVTFNLPLSRLDAAAVHRMPHGHGDIALSLCEGENIAYPHLWPHARPWRLSRTEPTLRCLPEAERVAGLLAQALAASAAQTRAPMPDSGPAESGLRGEPVLAA